MKVPDWSIYGKCRNYIWKSSRKRRGTYHDNSDLDIMILVNMTEDEIRQIKNSIYDLAFEIEMSTGIDIAPIIKEEQQYEYWADTLPFYKNIKEEGIVIWK